MIESNLKDKLFHKIQLKIDTTRHVADEEVYEIIDDILLSENGLKYLSTIEKSELRKELFSKLRKLDILEELIENPNVTEIMVNGIEAIFIEKAGSLMKYDREFKSAQKLRDVIQQIVSKCNRVVNDASPIVDARLENGSRVHVILPPIALNGPILTIRRFPEKPIMMPDLVKIDSITEEVNGYLRRLVIAGYNILISGGTGSGKTTFLNALSHYIPQNQRVITIEDSAELQIQGIANLVKLETRNQNVEGCVPITIRDLIKASLRMRPDRIIVGEVRGGEAIDMVQCMNTGHDGSISTIHANNAFDMIYRLETMILMGVDLPLTAIRRQISSGVDIIIHLGRLEDKTRKVIEIAEITGMEREEVIMQTIFKRVEKENSYGYKGTTLKKCHQLKNDAKWRAAGFESRDC